MLCEKNELLNLMKEGHEIVKEYSVVSSNSPIDHTRGGTFKIQGINPSKQKYIDLSKLRK